MPTFRITYPDHAEIENRDVVAEYYQRDEEWATFKDSNNKVVLDVKLRDVAAIEKVDADKTRTVTVKLQADTTEYVKAITDAAKATKKLHPRGM